MKCFQNIFSVHARDTQKVIITFADRKWGVCKTQYMNQIPDIRYQIPDIFKRFYVIH